MQTKQIVGIVRLILSLIIFIISDKIALAWIIHATSPARMQGRRGEAVLAYCEPRITRQTGRNRRTEGQHG